MKASGGNGERWILSLAGIPPWPKLLTREEQQGVAFWTREEYDRAVAAQPKGETDGNAATIKQKNKVGRPRKSSEDSEETTGKPTHAYFRREDGTLISKTELKLLSQKVRSLREDLLEQRYAPRTWGKIANVAWEYYSQTMLKEPGLSFLQLCDDGQWKLQEWSKLNYSTWSRRNGVHPVQTHKNKTDKKIESPLDQKDLIQIDPEADENDGTKDTLSDADQSCAAADDQNQSGDVISGRSNDAVETTAQFKSVVVNPLYFFHRFPSPASDECSQIQIREGYQARGKTLGLHDEYSKHGLQHLFANPTTLYRQAKRHHPRTLMQQIMGWRPTQGYPQQQTWLVVP
jgi:hypothetical protein